MGTETRPGKGVVNRGCFQIPGNPRTGGSGGSFRISEGNLTGRKNKKNAQITCLKATPSRKVPQTLTSATSNWGLNGEEREALLRNKRKTEQFQRRASRLRTGPSPAGGRGRGNGQTRPRDGTPYQRANRLPASNQRLSEILDG